jgi:hypothetical protein
MKSAPWLRFARRNYLLLIATGVLLALRFRPTDEKRITSLLNDLCAELNQTRDTETLTRLEADVHAVVDPHVIVHAPEFGQDFHEQSSLDHWSSELLTSVPLSFSLVDLNVQVKERTAHVSANLLATVRGSGEQRRDLRPTEVDLEKSAGKWRIVRVFMDPVRAAPPEARP